MVWECILADQVDLYFLLWSYYCYPAAWFGSSITYPVHPASEFPSDLYVDPKLSILLNILDNTCDDRLSRLPPLCLLLCLNHHPGTGALKRIEDDVSGPSCLPSLVTWGQISREHMDAAKPLHQRRAKE